MNTAEAIVRILSDSGVRHIFGLPGDTSMELYDALHRHREIQHILTRDERSAGFMADAYARVSGRVGICEGPSGGGASYVVPGVAEAQGSSSPVISFTTDTPVSQDGRNVLTEMDQEALFAAIAKWSHRIKSTDTAADVIRRALRVATSGRPGVASIILPEDILESEIEAPALYGVPDLVTCPSSRTRPDPEAVTRAADLISSAEKPVIVAGGGVRISGAWEELTMLTESMNIPVATSINGKGSISEESAVSIGIVGGNGARPYANEALREADLMILIGTRTNSVTTLNWTLPPKEQVKVVQIDVDPAQIGQNYQAETGVVGDAKLVLKDLLEAVDLRTALVQNRKAWLAELANRKQDYFDLAESKAAETSQPIKPQRVFSVLRRVLDPDTVIVADPGTPTPFTGAEYPLRYAGRYTAIPRAHGGLGFAIPGVVGAYYGADGKRVVGLTGDGSFGFSVGELETISRLDLPIPIIHFNNSEYGWIKELQHLFHGERYFSVDFNRVDYAGIAKGFGLESVQVTDPDDVEQAIRTALDSGKPWFIDVVSESPLTETPPVATWQAAEAARSVAHD
jgi:acetolactate synthase I/II/III large subunit